MFVEEIIGAFTGQNKRDRHRQVAIGTILGLLTGAAAGILLAPQSGKETREDICETVNKGATIVRDKAQEAYEITKDTAKDVGSQVRNWGKDVKIVLTKPHLRRLELLAQPPVTLAWKLARPDMADVLFPKL